jgi:hypothetical protein
MTFRPRRAFAGAMLALAARTPLLAAQATASVPRDLAEAFARLYAPADSAVSVDFLPGAVPGAVQAQVHLPPAARVIGTVALNRNTFVFASTPLSADSALRWIAHEYGRLHYEGLSQVRVPSAVAGGFRPAPPSFPTTFCQDSSEVTASAAHTPDGFTTIRLRVTSQSAACARVATVVRTPPPRPSGPLPILRDPPGTAPQSQCFLATSSQATTTKLSTAAEPSALLAQYGAQLEQQGWTRVDGPPPAHGVWMHRDSTGVTDLAAVTVAVTPLAPACRDAKLEITALRGR